MQHTEENKNIFMPVTNKIISKPKNNSMSESSVYYVDKKNNVIEEYSNLNILTNIEEENSIETKEQDKTVKYFSNLNV
jgi:CRISPR/Cas system type I-B associated protein Csh2 (Cas7 group RAMP superfamily)